MTVEPSSGSGETAAGDQNRAQPWQKPLHQRPRWVIVLAVAVAIAVLGLVLVMMLGGGKHGPGRHGSGSGGDPGLEGIRR